MGGRKGPGRVGRPAEGENSMPKTSGLFHGWDHFSRVGSGEGEPARPVI